MRNYQLVLGMDRHKIGVRFLKSVVQDLILRMLSCGMELQGVELGHAASQKP